MPTHAKTTQKKQQAAAAGSAMLRGTKESHPIKDNRPHAVAQRKLLEGINNSPKLKATPKALGATTNSEGQVAQRQVMQLVKIAGIDVANEGQMPTWTQDGKKYHINMKSETLHVTEEGIPKIQYFYEGFGDEIQDKQPTKEERGKKSKKKKDGKNVNTKKVFSDLPEEVQSFIKTNYSKILNVK